MPRQHDRVASVSGKALAAPATASAATSAHLSHRATPSVVRGTCSGSCWLTRYFLVPLSSGNSCRKADKPPPQAVQRPLKQSGVRSLHMLVAQESENDLRGSSAAASRPPNSSSICAKHHPSAHALVSNGRLVVQIVRNHQQHDVEVAHREIHGLVAWHRLVIVLGQRSSCTRRRRWTSRGGRMVFRVRGGIGIQGGVWDGGGIWIGGGGGGAVRDCGGVAVPAERATARRSIGDDGPSPPSCGGGPGGGSGGGRRGATRATAGVPASTTAATLIATSRLCNAGAAATVGARGDRPAAAIATVPGTRMPPPRASAAAAAWQRLHCSQRREQYKGPPVSSSALRRRANSSFSTAGSPYMSVRCSCTDVSCSPSISPTQVATLLAAHTCKGQRAWATNAETHPLLARTCEHVECGTHAALLVDAPVGICSGAGRGPAAASWSQMGASTLTL